MGLASVQVTNSMGANGCTYINDTLAHTGKFIAVQFTEASVVDSITGAMENSSAFDRRWNLVCSRSGFVSAFHQHYFSQRKGYSLQSLMPELGLRLGIGDVDADSIVGPPTGGPIIDGVYQLENGTDFFVNEAGTHYLAFETDQTALWTPRRMSTVGWWDPSDSIDHYH